MRNAVTHPWIVHLTCQRWSRRGLTYHQMLTAFPTTELFAKISTCGRKSCTAGITRDDDATLRLGADPGDLQRLPTNRAGNRLASQMIGSRKLLTTFTRNHLRHVTVPFGGVVHEKNSQLIYISPFKTAICLARNFFSFFSLGAKAT